jgi:hypothetical protein
MRAFACSGRPRDALAIAAVLGANLLAGCAALTAPRPASIPATAPASASASAPVPAPDAGAAASAASAAGPGATPGPGIDAMLSIAPALDAALDADMPHALELLAALPRQRLSPRDAATAACIRERFGGVDPAARTDLPAPAGEILAAYRSYWRRMLLREVPAPEAEAALRARLDALVPPAAGTARDLDAASDAARAAIDATGLHALAGVTSPLYELMLWRTQTTTRYEVALPEGRQDVTVVFLDDFVSLGWAAFATCDRAHTGGWAKSDALYAVRSVYELGSETFRVSYLAHEGQHFADYRRFPKLAQPELEYRAKLTELALADATTLDLVTGFATGYGSDRDVPHHYANGWVARNLAARLLGPGAGTGTPARWRDVPPAQIHRAAADLLRESTRALDALGAGTVERWLPDAP